MCKLGLTPGPCNQPAPKYRLGGDLAGQVYGNSAVDGDHVVVCCDVGNIDDIVRVVQFEIRVVVGKPYLVLGTGRKRRDDVFPRVKILSLASHHTLPH